MKPKAIPAFHRKIYYVFGVLTLLTFIAGVAFYYTESLNVEEDIRGKLERVAIVKSEEVRQWFKVTTQAGEDLLKNMRLRGQLLRLLNPEGKLIFDEAFAGMRKYLKVEKGFVALYLLDKNMKKLDTLSGSSKGLHDPGLIKQLAGIKKPTFGNFFSEETDSADKPFIYLLVPDTLSDNPSPLKYILIKIDPRADLLPRLWSATTILGSQENRLVVNIDSDPEYHWVLGSDGLSKRRLSALSPESIAYKIEQGDTGFINGIDYNGARAYGYAMSSGDYHFTLLAKISRDEIIGPVWGVFWKAVSGVSLALLILFILARLFLKQNENDTLKRVIEAEAAKERNEALLSAIIESSPDAILLVDPKNRVLLRYNKRAEIMFALTSSDEAIKLTPERFHKAHVSPKEIEEQKKALAEHGIWRGDVEYVALDGREFWGNVVVSTLEVGTDNFLMVRISDITREKKILTELQDLTEDLRRSDQEKVKFMSVLAHDLRSPFHPLLNVLELLNTDYDTMGDDEKKNFLSGAAEIAGRHFEFLESLLAWSRASLGKISYNPQALNPFRLINETILLQQHLAEQKGIKLTSKIDTTDDINADPEMLRTVLRNLLANAIKFTRNNGQVVVSAMTMNDMVIFGVSDNGVGIPKDQVELLFSLGGSRSTPGTENERGTGLGLLLCKEFVNRHGGEISVESSPGIGSSFSFTIPVYKNH